MDLNLISAEFDQCIKCGLCLATCPVNHELVLEKYTPRGKIQLARRYDRGDFAVSDHYRDIFAKCLLCGACNVTCPSGVDLTKVFTHMRNEIAAEKGIHPQMDPAVQSLLQHHNISREDNEERGDWREDMDDLPDHQYEKDQADVVYFVGCVASFFPMVQNIPQNMVTILSNADVDFAILGGEEWCCGFPLAGAGAEHHMKEFISHNLEKVRSLKAKKIVFSCPSCYRTWKEYYTAEFELFHSTQFISELIGDGALSFHELPLTVTYHDPCDLGRNGGVFEPPRKILNAIPGVKLVELENNRLKSVCCGGGGNVEMADASLSGNVANKKIEAVTETGAKTVVTACQQCVRTITGRVRREKQAIEVMDISTVVARALDHA